MEELLLAPERGFKLIGVSRSQGYKLLKSGVLPSIRIGRLRRVPVAQLRAWVDRQVTQAVDEVGGSETALKGIESL